MLENLKRINFEFALLISDYENGRLSKKQVMENFDKLLVDLEQFLDKNHEVFLLMKKKFATALNNIERIKWLDESIRLELDEIAFLRKQVGLV